MNAQNEFEQAIQDVQQLSRRPSDQDLLALYAFFKQAKEGDVTGSRPGMLDIKGRKKFDAWAAKKGLSSEEAVQGYIALVQKLKR